MSKAPEAAASFLKLSKDAEVYVFRRLRLMAGEPLSYTINYLPVTIGRNIQKKHLQQMTMLETLENIAGLELGVVEHEVEITRANRQIAEHLQIAPLDPVLTVKTSVYDSLQAPVEIVWTHFVENKYKFKVALDK